jgi:hypothetical protein
LETPCNHYLLRVIAASSCLIAFGLEAQPIQVNAWTNATSGNWEDLHWSLGILPGPNQAILLTNAGWKALAIGPGTVQNAPQSLNVDSITVSTPPDSFNVLLLNYAGYQTPITANAITLNSNTVMSVLASVLDVTNTANRNYRLEVGGTVNQGEMASVNTSILSLGNIGPGVYNLTNGTLNVVTGYVGGAFAGRINQFGGQTVTTALRIIGQGEYNLYAGSVSDRVELYSGGLLKQFGGAFQGDLSFYYGTYELHGGLMTSTNLSIPASDGTGALIQIGGTNQINGPLSFWPSTVPGYLSGGSYSLSNGVLSAVRTLVGPNGVFQQTGGIFTNQEDLVFTYTTVYPPYTIFRGEGMLAGGWLGTGSMAFYGTHFSQSGGTNQIATSMTIEGYLNGGSCDYELSGGSVCASNLVVLGLGGRALLTQTGGSLFANNLSLYVPPNGTLSAFQDQYDLSGGNLVVSNIELNGYAAFRHRGGTLIHQGLLTLAGGRWEAQTTGEQFGWLQLAYRNSDDNTNSFLSLPANACIIHFADSSSLAWSNAVKLTISNWAGLPEGGGSHQIIFGANDHSLTGGQLSEISFANVSGLPSGEYPARLLPSGELVPIVPIPVAVAGLTRLSNGTVSLAMSTVAGKNYGIAVSTDLSQWTWWTNQISQGGTITFIDGSVPNFPARFYRAFVLP